jgi:hypothetical protein
MNYKLSSLALIIFEGFSHKGEFTFDVDSDLFFLNFSCLIIGIKAHFKAAQASGFLLFGSVL